ncbi:MAG: PhzF family phenazine biosynthesis protein [Flavisolibacter sp.]
MKQNSVTLPIYQVDAFAENVFAGNPAAVVPLSQWLSNDVMQNIAMENNLSETAFFVKTGDNADYHLRWFTPEFEIDLCGHATLASAYVIKKFSEPDISIIRFSTEKAGVLQVSFSGDDITLDFPARMPQSCDTPDVLLESLGISEAVEVLKSRDYFVVLPNEEAVKNISPDVERMKDLDAVGVIVTARGQSADFVSRCFYPGAGITEDPVTGSAHCNVVPYWHSKTGMDKMRCRQLSARGGELLCQLKDDRVLMSGKAVLFMKGEIYL